VIFFLHGTADVAAQQATFLAEMRALAAVYKAQAVFIHLNTADTSAYVRRIMEDVKVVTTWIHPPPHTAPHQHRCNLIEHVFHSCHYSACRFLRRTRRRR